MKRLVLLLSLVLPMMLGAQQWEIVREDASVLTGGIINDKYEAVLIGHELNADGTCFGLIAKVGTDGSYETIIPIRNILMLHGHCGVCF